MARKSSVTHNDAPDPAVASAPAASRTDTDPQTAQNARDLNREAWDRAMTDPLMALELSDRAYRTAEETGDTAEMANATLNQGWANYYLSRLADAFNAFSQAAGLFGQLDDARGRCLVLNAFGVYYASMFRLDKEIGRAHV